MPTHPSTATHGLRAQEAVGPATLESPQRFYRPELDALRFLAFLLVYMCHVLQNAGLDSVLGVSSPRVRMVGGWLTLFSEVGAFGVSLFFVLSAYLITELMLLEYARTGAFKIKDFYVRRILRIWPLYFSVIGLFIFLGWVHPQEFRVRPMQILAYLALSGNWYIILRGTFPAQMGVLWSISIEEQFYLLWPSIFRAGKRRGIMIACVIFPLLAAALLGYFGIAGVGRTTAWMNSLVQFIFFALGGGLALLLHRRVPRMRWPWRAALAFGGFSTWLVIESFTHIQQRNTTVHTGGLLVGFAGVALGTSLIFLSVLGIRPEKVPCRCAILEKFRMACMSFIR